MPHEHVYSSLTQGSQPTMFGICPYGIIILAQKSKLHFDPHFQGLCLKGIYILVETEGEMKLAVEFVS